MGKQAPHAYAATSATRTYQIIARTGDSSPPPKNPWDLTWALMRHGRRQGPTPPRGAQNGENPRTRPNMRKKSTLPLPQMTRFLLNRTSFFLFWYYHFG